ncbi:MAG: hypothetical protein JW779_13855 [Candidatus Thorarchaeota archaeon]|nr:hypothetical protein [Candidatus Thorarchaeota archaeon]
MMSTQADVTTPQFQLIWGHLRNLIDFEKVVVPGSIRLVGTICGEFPVDAYTPIFLEIAKEHRREDLSGRFNCPGSTAGQVLYDNYWHPIRTIPLPLFNDEPDLTIQELREGYSQLLKEWHNSRIPENLPCAAVSLKFHGNYCEEREAQKITVLLIYPNCTARLLYLDFFEGALEDCISPEWYLSVSMLKSIYTAIEEFREIPANQFDLQHTWSSIFIKPNFLGDILIRGKRIETSLRKWGFEWKYGSYYDLSLDLRNLLDELQDFFTK